MSDDWQVRGGATLEAWRCQAVGAYNPVPGFFPRGQAKGRKIEALLDNSVGELLVIAWAADGQFELLSQQRRGPARICIHG